jgi:hypothetical protein
MLLPALGGLLGLTAETPDQVRPVIMRVLSFRDRTVSFPDDFDWLQSNMRFVGFCVSVLVCGFSFAQVGTKPFSTPLQPLVPESRVLTLRMRPIASSV